MEVQEFGIIPTVQLVQEEQTELMEEVAMMMEISQVVKDREVLLGSLEIVEQNYIVVAEEEGPMMIMDLHQ